MKCNCVLLTPNNVIIIYKTIFPQIHTLFRAIYSSALIAFASFPFSSSSSPTQGSILQGHCDEMKAILQLTGVISRGGQGQAYEVTRIEVFTDSLS